MIALATEREDNTPGMRKRKKWTKNRKLSDRNAYEHEDLPSTDSRQRFEYNEVQKKSTGSARGKSIWFSFISIPEQFQHHQKLLQQKMSGPLKREATSTSTVILLVDRSLPPK